MSECLRGVEFRLDHATDLFFPALGCIPPTNHHTSKLHFYPSNAFVAMSPTTDPKLVFFSCPKPQCTAW